MLVLFQGCSLLYWVRNSGFLMPVRPLATVPPLLDNNANRKQICNLTVLQICTKNKVLNVLTIRIYRWSHCGRCGKKGVLKNSCSETCQMKFAVKILEKYLWKNPSSVMFNGRSLNVTKNELFHKYFLRIMIANLETYLFSRTPLSGCFWI